MLYRAYISRGGTAISNVIIGIHGLSNKPKSDILEDWWRNAILEGLRVNEGIEIADFDFSSVYWVDRMYPEPDPNPDKYEAAATGALQTYDDGWFDVVRSVTLDFAGVMLDSMKENFGIDKMADGVLSIKLEDLSRYYKEPGKKEELRGLLEKEISNNAQNRIMVLSHSMGTIIAYDVLRAIGKHNPGLSVEYFITLGSPLGLPHVKYKIMQENSDVRTPSVVKNWLNFADKRDPVALDTHLASDYRANNSGVRVKDDLVLNDWGGIHHKSYGYLRTPEVSKVIKSFI